MVSMISTFPVKVCEPAVAAKAGAARASRNGTATRVFIEPPGTLFARARQQPVCRAQVPEKRPECPRGHAKKGLQLGPAGDNYECCFKDSGQHAEGVGGLDAVPREDPGQLM